MGRREGLFPVKGGLRGHRQGDHLDMTKTSKGWPSVQARLRYEEARNGWMTTCNMGWFGGVDRRIFGQRRM
jgi:hypothetical protein